MGSPPAHQLDMTHRGTVHEYGVASKNWRKHVLKLRESKAYWVSELGHKFHKKDGSQVGLHPLYELALESIEVLR